MAQTAAVSTPFRRESQVWHDMRAYTIYTPALIGSRAIDSSNHWFGQLNGRGMACANLVLLLAEFGPRPARFKSEHKIPRMVMKSSSVSAGEGVAIGVHHLSYFSLFVTGGPEDGGATKHFRRY